MGIVYRAMHLDLHEPVALKVMLPQLATVDELVARFLHEARATAKLKSPNVARVFDAGRLDDGSPYLVMELLEGMSVSDRIDDSGPLAVDVAIAIVRDACAALEEAHALGIVHRDLKPANLFLARSSDGRVVVKLLDFGISKTAFGAADLSRTETGLLMGSPLYMSPEQMRSARAVDARSDVWSLGVLLYKLVTGSTPWDADGFGELVLDVHTKAPRPMRELREDVPDALEAAVADCLACDRDARCPSARDLAAKLDAIVPRGSVSLDRMLEPSPATGVAGAAADPNPSAAPTDTIVVDRLREAAAAWPGIFVAPARFRSAVAVAVASGARIDSLHVGDLYLALACLDGDLVARAALASTMLEPLEPIIARARPRGTSREDASAAVHRRLLGDDGLPGRLADYGGLVPLLAWVRAAALRMLVESGIRARDSEPAPPPDACEDDAAAIAKEVLGRLTPEQRTALRFQIEDGLSIDRIAPMLGLDPSALATSMSEARRRLFAEARAILEARGAGTLANVERVRAALACLAGGIPPTP